MVQGHGEDDFDEGGPMAVVEERAHDEAGVGRGKIQKTLPGEVAFWSIATTETMKANQSMARRVQSTWRAEKPETR